MLKTSRRWPGLRVLATTDSRPPVPEVVRITISCCVWKAHARPSRHSRKIAAKAAPRWAIISPARAARTAGGNGVGPGVRKFRAAIRGRLYPRGQREVPGDE